MPPQAPNPLKPYDLYAVGALAAGAFPTAGEECIGNHLENDEGIWSTFVKFMNYDTNDFGKDVRHTDGGLYLSELSDDDAVKIRMAYFAKFADPIRYNKRAIPLQKMLDILTQVNYSTNIPTGSFNMCLGKRKIVPFKWNAEERDSWNNKIAYLYQSKFKKDLRKCLKSHAIIGDEREHLISMLKNFDYIEPNPNTVGTLQLADDASLERAMGAASEKSELMGSVPDPKSFGWMFCLTGRYAYPGDPTWEPVSKGGLTITRNPGNELQLLTSAFGRSLEAESDIFQEEIPPKKSDFEAGMKELPEMMWPRKCWLSGYPIFDFGTYFSNGFGKQEAEHVLPYGMSEALLVLTTQWKEVGYSRLKTFLDVELRRRGGVAAGVSDATAASFRAGGAVGTTTGGKAVKAAKIAIAAKAVSTPDEIVKLEVLKHKASGVSDNIRMQQQRARFDLIAKKISVALKPSAKLPNQIKSNVPFLVFKPNDNRLVVDNETCGIFLLVLGLSMFDSCYKDILMSIEDSESPAFKAALDDFTPPVLQKTDLDDILKVINDASGGWVGRQDDVSSYLITSYENIYKQKNFNRDLSKPLPPPVSQAIKSNWMSTVVGSNPQETAYNNSPKCNGVPDFAWIPEDKKTAIEQTIKEKNSIIFSQ